MSAKPVPSQRRHGPVDVEAAEFQKMKPGQPKCEVGDYSEADHDRYHNLRKFERHDDMAAEPNRGKGNESGQR